MEVSSVYFLFFFLLGLLLPAPWITWLHSLDDRRATINIAAGLLVAALIYPGFALYEGDILWLFVECFGVGLYGVCAWLALRSSMIWLAVGWILHPLWDAALHWLGPGAHIVPPWYAIACLSFDLAIALYVVMRMNQSKLRNDSAAI